MKNFAFAAVIFFAAIFQTTFMPKVAFLGVMPNAVFLALFTTLFVKGLRHTATHPLLFREKMFWAALAGLLLDLFSNYPFGAITAGFAAGIALIFFLLENVFDKKDVLSAAASVFMGTVTYHAVISLFLIISSASPPAGGRMADVSDFGFVFWRFAAPEGIVNALIALLLIYLFLKSWTNRTILKTIN